MELTLLRRCRFRWRRAPVARPLANGVARMLVCQRDAMEAARRAQEAAGGLLHDFVRDKFPSIDFNLYPLMLKKLVKLIQVDHIVSSGADFDENLWSLVGVRQHFHARLLRGASDITHTSAQARLPRHQRLLRRDHGHAAQARAHRPLRLGPGGVGLQPHRRPLRGGLEPLESASFPT